MENKFSFILLLIILVGGCTGEKTHYEDGILYQNIRGIK